VPARFERQVIALVMTIAVGIAVVAWGLRGEVACVVILAALSRGTRSNASRMPRPRDLFQAALVGLASAGVVVVTFTSAVWKPDKRIMIPFGKPPLIVLLLGVALVALLNASLEELIWRQQLVNVLLRTGVSSTMTGALQAMSFGLAHVRGIPGGVVGVILTTGFALAAHQIVRRSGTVITGVVAHWIADIAIFTYLLSTLVDFQGQGLRYG
jgi:hypothetical protein